MISINRKAVRAAGGTQSDELQAKIKSVTSSTTVGAVFIYDTRNDSDSGAWRKKTSHTSWAREAASATRSSRSEFPSVALIVADDDGVTIYDGDDPSLPAWLVANVGGESSSPNKMTALGGGTIGNIGSAFALNGRIYLGGGSTTGSQALLVWDFVEDFFGNYDDAAARGGRAGTIAERNTQVIVDGSFNTIVSSVVNDVAATYLEGGELDSLGLVRPVVACATNGGVSVIHPNGDVYDQTDTISSNNQSYDVFWDDKGGLFFGSRGISSASTYLAYERNTLYADKSTSASYAYAPSGATLSNKIIFLGSGGPYINGATKAGDNIAIGSSQGLSLIKHNDGNPDEGMVSYHTSDFCTGYMLGDIKGAWLTGGDASAEGRYDRSVGNTDLVENGTVLHAAAETDAEVTKYYDFSASNYFSQANNSDFDFGTGDFSVMFWTKFTSAGTSQVMVDRSVSGTPRFLVYNTSGNILQFYIHDGSSATSVNAGSFGDNNWHQVVCVKRGTSSISIFVDGILKDEDTSIVTGTFSSATAKLHIGVNRDQNDPLSNGSLSLVRISATAPTPTQVADIYREEAKLFRSGAKCLLQSNSGTPNVVNDLSYDPSTDILSVAQSANTEGGINFFRGLQLVDTFNGTSHGWNFAETDNVSTNGGVVVGTRTNGTGGVLVDLPAIDVRGDINTADTKLPDDGKIRFTGVTTDATQTTIGTIFINENETYTIRAKVTGHRYSEISSDRVFTELEQTFYRKIGADVQEPAAHRKIEDLVVSSTDVSLVRSTGNNTVNLKVTGVAGQRLEWNATVEVQRISEKQYER